jgi:predicted permease
MLSDLRLALRLLFKSPAFTLIAVLTLGLGIGANTAIFSFINAFFLKSFTVQRPEELVNLYTTDEGNPGLLPLSHPNFSDYRDQNQVFAGLSVYGFAPANLLLNGEPSQIFGEIVSGNYFELLGVRATLGRTFRPEEYQTVGTHPVAVLGHSFWQTQLAGDRGIIGREVMLNGTAFTVVGIAPADFKGLNTLNSPAFWVTTASYKQILNGIFLNFFELRRALLFSVVARLRPGVVLTQAEAGLKPIAEQLAQQFPNDNKDRGVKIVSLAQSGINPNQRQNFKLAGTLLLSLSGLVLLIACANIANLLLARATARQREVAVRLALGADRARLIRQFLTESLLLALLGGGAGLIIAEWTQQLLWSFRPPFLPQDMVISLDGRVLGFGLVIALLTGLLFGLAPAWSATKPELTTTLKEETAGSAARAPLFSLRNFLVAGQIALSVVALIIAGLFIRSLRHAQQTDTGWNTNNLALLSVNVAAQGYDGERAVAYYRTAIERASATPGVTHATVASGSLLNGGGPLRTLRPQGDDEKLRTTGQLTGYLKVAPGFFKTMGIPQVAGRDFTEADDSRHPMVVIVNQTFAKLHWPNRDAVGQTIKVFGSEDPVEIVGVIQDVVFDNIGEDPKPYAFFSIAQETERDGFATIHVRTRSDAAALMPTIRKQLQSLDPALPFVNVTTMDENIRQGLWAPRAGAALLSVFGLLAMVLAAIGVYGIMAYTVGKRTREIGIRMAVGAQASDVLGLILHRGLLVVGAGLAAGLVLAFALTRYFQNLLIGVNTSDPVTYALIAGLLAAVALLACWLPARRATKIDPLLALRSE